MPVCGGGVGGRLVQWGPRWIHFNMSRGTLYRGDPCMVMSNSSWVMVTWDTPCGQNDRHTHNWKYYFLQLSWRVVIISCLSADTFSEIGLFRSILNFLEHKFKMAHCLFQILIFSSDGCEAKLCCLLCCIMRWHFFQDFLTCAISSGISQ